MSGFAKAIQDGISLMKRGDDDTYDRLSSRYSVAVCIVFAFLVSGGKWSLDTPPLYMESQIVKTWKFLRRK